MDLVTFLQFLFSGITTGCVYALVALGFVLCANVSGVINFAQGEYVMMGGIATAMFVNSGIALPLSVGIAVALGAVIGAAQERLTVAPVRDRSLFIKVTITIAVSIIIRTCALVIGGKDPLNVPGFSGEGTFKLYGAILPAQTIWVWVTTMILMIATLAFLKGTKLGRAIRASATNVVAAQLMGVNVSGLRLLVFAAAGALGALAGAVIAPITEAYWLAGLDFGLKGFIGALIGNFRSPLPAVAGGLSIGILESLATGYVSSGFKDVIVYGALLLYLLIHGGVFAARRLSLTGK